MPALSDHDLLAMRSWLERCPSCTGQVLKNYCRECDEFFVYNHWRGCPTDSANDELLHTGHRTY